MAAHVRAAAAAHAQAAADDRDNDGLLGAGGAAIAAAADSGGATAATICGNVDIAAGPNETIAYELVNENEDADEMAEASTVVKRESAAPVPLLVVVEETSVVALHQSPDLAPVPLFSPPSTAVAAPLPVLKRRAPAEDAPQTAVVKKQRPSVQTIATGATKKRREEEEKQDDSQEIEDEEEINNSSNTPLASVDSLPVEPVAKERLGDLPDFLLNYDNPIGDTCNVNKRTPAQTKDFNERLRKAIGLADA